MRLRLEIPNKRKNVMMNMKPNEKLQSYVIKFCGRSYMHISIIRSEERRVGKEC